MELVHVTVTKPLGLTRTRSGTSSETFGQVLELVDTTLPVESSFMYTKKDFKLAASIVAAERVPGFVKMTDEVREEIAHAFVAFFQSEVSKFNRTKFLEACGVIAK